MYCTVKSHYKAIVRVQTTPLQKNFLWWNHKSDTYVHIGPMYFWLTFKIIHTSSYTFGSFSRYFAQPVAQSYRICVGFVFFNLNVDLLLVMVIWHVTCFQVFTFIGIRGIEA